MTKRKFRKYIVEIELLSEEPWDDLDCASLSDIDYEMTEGHCSGRVKIKSDVELNGLQMAKALMKQGSDPEFFLIDEKGRDIDIDEM